MRSRMSFKGHARKFNKARKRTRAVNVATHVSRGGTRF